MSLLPPGQHRKAAAETQHRLLELEGCMCILFEKLKSLPSGNVVCFVETGVSKSSPLPVCRQFRGEAVV